jgi:hypothetical protein
MPGFKLLSVNEIGSLEVSIFENVEKLTSQLDVECFGDFLYPEILEY